MLVSSQCNENTRVLEFLSLSSTNKNYKTTDKHLILNVTVFANQVKYWRKYDDPEPGANRIFVPATFNQTRLENMLPDSHYLIEVRAFNGAGLGPPGEHCEMFTKRPRKRNLEAINTH